jgi:hypothetical protein
MMSKNQFYILIFVLIFLGLCFFFASGGVYEYQKLDGNLYIRINKLSGKAYIVMPQGNPVELKILRKSD